MILEFLQAGRGAGGGFTASLAVMLRSWAGRLIGESGRQNVIGTVSWSDLGAVLGVVLFALIVHGLTAWYLRRKTRGAAARGAQAFRHHVFGALGKPLYALIWVCGIYVGATTLSSKLPPGDALDTVEAVTVAMLDLGVAAALFWGIYRFTHVLDARLAVWASKTHDRMDAFFAALLGGSLRVLVPVLGVIVALQILNFPRQYAHPLTQATSILMIVAVAIVLLRAVGIAQNAVLSRYDITAADNLQARKMYTQVHVIGKMVRVVIVVLTAASVLMVFDAVRQIGASVLASAGIVGIVAGIAAQKTLGNLFAGFQIALTQPMRQDDVVIVEGEWGRIEEITLSYVVVHIWDDRRLVVPLSYFIEKPFENWTRSSAALLGSVFVWVDYSFPVDAGRSFLKGLIESSASWDKRFWNLTVTDATERTMKLRVLATAEDSSKSWDLCCEIREKFIAFIQVSFPRCLPQIRVRASGDEAAVAGDA